MGLELDSGEARAVELTGNPTAPSLAALGRVPLPPGAVSEGMVLQPGAVAGALEKLWSQAGIVSREVILGVFNQAVLVRIANFPAVPADKVVQMVRYQAQEHIPVPLSTVVLDHAVIGKAPGESENTLEVLLVAARRDMLQSFLSTLEAARMKALDIDVSPLALIRNLPPQAARGTVAVLDIALGLSNFLIVSRNAPRLVRLLPTGVQKAAEQLGCTADDLIPAAGNGNLPPFPDLIDEAAATLTEEIPAGEDHSQGWLDGALAAWAGSLEGEVRSSIGYYLGQPGASPVDGLLLSGRGARLEGLSHYLQRRLKIPVDIMKPMWEINHREDPTRFPSEQDFSVSVGLSRRGLEV
ncbi:MAG: type IV pilus assembly protein PilM [Bacillota bacterium]